MQSELLPIIDKNYRTNSFRILIGMSPSAAFALHSFWKAPDLFDAHFLFAATDVIGMGYTAETTFIDKIADSLAKNPDRKGYLYVSSAQREAEKNPVRIKNIKMLEAVLKPYTALNFRLKAEHTPEFGHYPSAIPGLLSALDLVFPRENWDMSGKFKSLIAEDGNALENIKGYYEKLSRDVGFDVFPNADLRRNANCYRSIARRLANQERYQESIETYQQWIKDSPRSAAAHSGLANLLEMTGQQDAALINKKKATDLKK